MSNITPAKANYIRSLQADKGYQRTARRDPEAMLQVHERDARNLMIGRATTDDARIAEAVAAAQATDRRSDEREVAVAAIVTLLAEQFEARRAERLAMLDLDPATLTREQASQVIDGLKAL